VHKPIPVDISTEPFDSAPRLIVRTTKVFLSSWPWLAAITLTVSVPGKLAVQGILAAFEISPESLLSYFVAYATDLVWNALIAAAVIYGVAVSLRTGRLPAWRTTLRQGRTLWAMMLWNDFKVEITVLLWSLLLIVPGIIATLRLILVQPIVVLDRDTSPDPLSHSRKLTQGRLWRIALALLPLIPLGAAHLYAAFRTLKISPFVMVPIDSLFTILDQWATVAALLIYLGVAPKPTAVRTPPRSRAKRRE